MVSRPSDWICRQGPGSFRIALFFRHRQCRAIDPHSLFLFFNRFCRIAGCKRPPVSTFFLPTVNIKIEDINDTRKKILVAVEASEVDKERASVVRDIAKVVRIPGFRPGKAPLPMVEKRYSREIQDELNKKLLSESYRQGLKETKVEPVKLLNVSGGEIKTGENNELVFELDIRPDFTLPNYTGLELTRQSDEVKDEEVEGAINQLRDQRADFNVVERAAEKGDYLKLSYEGKIGEQPVAEIVADRPVFGKQTGTWEEAGAAESAIPGFADALLGLKAGDAKEIPVAFPEDFSEEPLRGKEAVYAVEVTEVRERILPELTDEFAKGLGLDDVAQLKERVRADLEQRRKAENRNALRNQAAEKLASQIEFPLPETILEAETEEVLRGFLEQNMRRGVPQEAFEERKQELYEGARKVAVQRSKVRMILGRIAEKEKLTVENEDFGRFIMAEARRTNQKPDKIAKDLRNDRDRVETIRTEIILDKTLEFLVEKATISDSTSQPKKES